VIRPALGDLVLGEALPGADPQLAQALVGHGFDPEAGRQRRRRLHGPGQGAGGHAVDRLAGQGVGHRLGGPDPPGLDALVAPPHGAVLAVPRRAAVADQVDGAHVRRAAQL
jgi:hypothetical protein